MRDSKSVRSGNASDEFAVDDAGTTGGTGDEAGLSRSLGPGLSDRRGRGSSGLGGSTVSLGSGEESGLGEWVGSLGGLLSEAALGTGGISCHWRSKVCLVGEARDMRGLSIRSDP